MSSSSSDQFEETIRPIARPRSETEFVADATLPDDSARKLPRRIAIAIALLVAVLAVYFMLPGDADEPLPEQTVEVEVSAEVAAEPPAEPVLSEADRRRLDAESQRDLAALLTQQDRLRTSGAEDWGAERFVQYIELATAGDDAYLAEDLVTSAQSYARALELGNELLEYSQQLFGQFVTEGFAAIEAADWMTARERFAAAIAIDPEDLTAQDGRARARTLPDVLDLMDEAADADERGELPLAIELYESALATDAQWTPARDALASARSRLAQYRFDQQLNAAYGALAGSRFQDALDEFDAALAMRPNSQAAQDGRFQAEEGLRLGQIQLARVRALAFETRELWSEAIAQYEAALATDPTLEYANEGLERSRVRRDLELKISNLLENPRLLFDDSVLADAKVLRDQAAALQPRGARIDEQQAELDNLISAATREYPITFVSDGLTNVTIFRIGTIGTFSSTQVQLRPGNYTAVGSKNGFRDVRTSFTVLPGRESAPIEVICREPI